MTKFADTGTRHLFKFKSLSLLALSLLLVSLLAACGEDPKPTVTPPTPTVLVPPSPTPAPDARTIAKAAAEKLKTINSLHFLVNILTGQVDIYNGISFKKAEGDFLQPTSYKAKLRVSVAIAQVDAEIVGVGNEQCLSLRNLGNSWQKLPADVGFKASVLFDPEKGLGAVVTKVKDIEIVGTEQLDGVEVYHLKGIVAGTDIAPITASTLGKTDVDYETWIGKSDSIIRKVTFKERSTDPNASNWELTFSKFNDPVKIEKPC